MVAQQFPVKATESHSVEVRGKAELVVPSNEFELQISLHDFSENQPVGDIRYYSIITVQESADSVLKILQQYSMDSIRVESSGTAWRTTKEDIRLFKFITAKTTDASAIDSVLRMLPNKGLQMVRVIGRNTNLENYKKQVQMQAITTAKEKARYLAGLLDKRLGDVLRIEEEQDYLLRDEGNSRDSAAYSLTNGSAWGVIGTRGLSALSGNSMTISGDNQATSDPSRRAVTLHYGVRVLFELR